MREVTKEQALEDIKNAPFKCGNIVAQRRNPKGCRMCLGRHTMSGEKWIRNMLCFREFEKQYGHTIRNPHILHWTTTYGGSEPHTTVYICIKACSITPEKVADTIEAVTCKKCIQLLKKEGAL